MKRNKKNYLIKGIYGHPQIGGYFVVKQYMMLEQNGKHCLLLRFQNELKTTVQAVEFVLKQLDSAGKTLGRVKITYSDLSIRGGELYAPEQGIVIHDDCVDVIVQMRYVISENIKYLYRKGIVTAHYSTRGFEEQKTDSAPQRNRVQIKRSYAAGRKPYRAIAWISLLLVILTIGLLIAKAQETYRNQPDASQAETTDTTDTTSTEETQE